MAKLNPSKLLKTLTIGQGAILVPHIDRYLERGKLPDKWEIEVWNAKRPRTEFAPEDEVRFNPYEDSLLDPQVLYEKYTTDAKPIWSTSAASARTQAAGHLWHGYLQALLVSMGFVDEEDVERYTVRRIVTKRGHAYCSGQADLVNVRIPGHGSWLIDIKSQNKTLFEQGLSGEMMRKYTAQINLYSDWFDAEQAMILAVSKDSPHDLREYIIPKDQALIDSIYDRWTFVAQCIRAKVSPNETIAAS